MPRITESMEIELMCSSFRILRDLAESKEQSLDECVSDILEKYIDQYVLSRKESKEK